MITDNQGSQIRFNDERWHHIITRHPELRNKQKGVIKTIQHPDLIIASRLDRAIHLYHKIDRQTKLYQVVIVNVEKKFIITSYLTDKIKIGKKIWPTN